MYSLFMLDVGVNTMTGDDFLPDSVPELDSAVAHFLRQFESHSRFQLEKILATSTSEAARTAANLLLATSNADWSRPRKAK